MIYLLALTFLLAPTYIIRFNIGPFPANLLMLWVVFLWMAMFIYLSAKRRWRECLASILSVEKKVLILIGLFFLAGIISLFTKGFEQKKLGQFIVLFLQPISIFFIARFIFKKRPQSKYLILNTIYFILAASGIYAILQYFTLLGLPQDWWGNSVEPKRALAFFVHPNFYALWCTPLLALLIPDVSQCIQNWKLGIGYWKFIFAWLLGAIGLLLSFSRAGWLGLGVAVLAYLVVAADKKIRQLFAAAAVVLIVIVAIIPNLRYRVILPLYGEKSTVSRLSLWQTGWKGIKESPALGLGLTGFSRQWPALNTDPGLTDTHNFPHNIFLDLWVETGIIGLISLIGLIGLDIFRGLKNRKDILALGVSLFLIALVVQGQIDNPYFKNDLAMVFWIILALTA